MDTLKGFILVDTTAGPVILATHSIVSVQRTTGGTHMRNLDRPAGEAARQSVDIIVRTDGEGETTIYQIWDKSVSDIHQLLAKAQVEE